MSAGLIPRQTITAGRLESAWRKEVARLAAADAIGRMWRKDAALWKSEESHGKVIRNRLGWLDVVEPMKARAGELAEFAQAARAEGFRDVALLGMGGSSLTPEVFSLVFPAPLQSAHFHVVDSTDPASVLAVGRGPGSTGHGADLRHTLFVVASKSGKTIETLTQTNYFLKEVQEARGGTGPSGGEPPGGNFVAITDEGSYLDQLAVEKKFRKVFRNPADIGGRYSALSLFGLAPAALWGIELGGLLDSAAAMRQACGPGGASGEGNPALALGALMGAAAQNGCDKMLLLSTESLTPLGNWIEQLVAESTGKEGKGVIPVAGEIPGDLSVYGEDCYAVSLVLEGEASAEIERLSRELGQRGAPVVEIRLGQRSDLAAEFFRWEAATAIAGVTLGVNPFDEPNVQESKDNTGRLLADLEKTGRMPSPSAAAEDGGIEIHLGGSLRGKKFDGRLAGAGRLLETSKKTGDYLAILAFLDRNERYASALETAWTALRDALRIPVLLGFGPRYLHSIGQLYKGGPASGLFLILTAADAEDVAIPGSKYSFSQLKMAQALGDWEALEKRGKPLVRLHFGEGAEAGLRRIAEMAGPG